MLKFIKFLCKMMLVTIIVIIAVVLFFITISAISQNDYSLYINAFDYFYHNFTKPEVLIRFIIVFFVACLFGSYVEKDSIK